MSLVLCIVFFLLLPYSEARNITSGGNSDQDSYEFCQPTSCNSKGPQIRFPFRLDTQNKSCGLEGFELSCSDNKTRLHLPFSGYYYVQNINYLENIISIADSQRPCTLQSFQAPNFSTSKFFPGYFTSFTIMNCTDQRIRKLTENYGRLMDCISDERSFVYAIPAGYETDRLPSNSVCRIINRSLTFPEAFSLGFTKRTVHIDWEDPYQCNYCESSGKFCGLNTTTNSRICVRHKHNYGCLIVVISVVTSIGAIVFFGLLKLVVHRLRISKNEQKNQQKVERFLEDYRTVNPTRYTYSELKNITGKFNHRLGQGGFGSVFRGKLSNGIPVAVKMLEHSKGNGEEFINEVATIGRIHHFNIVRLLGFYSEGTRRALIYEFLPNGSLEKLIFSRINNSNHRPLSWEKLQNIAIGVARGIDYLHQGCNQIRILHFDIKPHNILLDHNFQPKISDFGLAKLCSKEQSIVSLTAARGTTGYIAPELFSRHFGEVSYKSDVFSYGMMLLEMVGCRKNIDITIENESQIYFPEWIYNKMSQGKELHLEIEVDGDEEIAKKLAIVALWCIQWNPTERPSMSMVLQMLEGGSQSLEMPPKPFVSSDAETG